MIGGWQKRQCGEGQGGRVELCGLDLLCIRCALLADGTRYAESYIKAETVRKRRRTCGRRAGHSEQKARSLAP